MPITTAQIDIWRQSKREHPNLEFKEAKVQFDNKRLYKYCVAIANEGGGLLVLGVKDKPPREVVGTHAFNDPSNMASKLFNNVGFRVELEEVDYHGLRILVFQIPSRPRGTAYNIDGSYLMRSGEELVPMSEDRLRKIFSEGAPDWLSEVSLADITEQKVIDLLDTQTFYELLDSSYPSGRPEVIDKLVRERMISKTDSGYSISRIGALLLARDLKNFPDVVRKAPRVVVYEDNSKLKTKLDVPGTKGYAVGFAGLVAYIMSHLPQNEVVEGAIRKEIKLVSEDVIRELVANALIHQEFLETGTSILIEIYKNRVEISNPGEPILPIDRFIDGYQSRNERLANLMRQLRICEEKSSGIDRVVKTAEIYQLPAPDFQTGARRTTAIIFGPRPFRSMTQQDRVRACFQHCALQFVLREPMTNQSLRKRFGVTERSSAAISQIISKTVEAGLIKQDISVGESRKLARYVPHWA